jgi:urease accessory protein
MTLHADLARLEDARELDAYRDQPTQMRAAAPGKVGDLRLGFALRGDRSELVDLYRAAPLLVQQALYWDEEMPDLPICAIITIGGGYLQGDRYRISIGVAEGASAHVHSQGANRIHSMDANYAAQLLTVRVDAGGYLEYLPEVTIPYRGSRFLSRTELVVAPDATLLYAEMLMTGRKHHAAHERFGFDLLSMAVTVRRPCGRVLFAEKVLVGKEDPTVDFAAVMRGFDAFANVLCLTPPSVAARIRERYTGLFPTGAAWAMAGLSRLPDDAGLVLRVAGIESHDIRREVRRFWQIVREEARGHTLPPAVLWR